MKYILQLQDVEYEYPDGTKALKGVSIAVEKGKKIAVLGANGAGKSTLFLHLNGILKPKKGKLFYNGEEVRYDRKSLIQLRKKVGIVFQNPDIQLFAASVEQEVSFGPMNLNLPIPEVKQRVEDSLKSTDTYPLKDKPTHFLSYGQKKRVSIADVLAMDPEIIIFDEPTAYLDPYHIEGIIDIFNALSIKGKTIIVSTHDVELAYSWADYIYIMKEGEIVSSGTPDKVFYDSKLLQMAKLKKPMLVEIYSLLVDRGIIKHQHPPRNMEELRKIL